MAQAPNGKTQVEPHDDLYTTLLIISAVVLFFGIIFMAVRSFEFFGSLWAQGTSN